MAPTPLETSEEPEEDATTNAAELYGVDLTESGDGGVRKVVLAEGAGLTVPHSSTVLVKYVGKFLNGQEFDSNLCEEPFQFVLGQGVVIRGWDIGLASMRKGEKACLTVQPEYGYGKQGGSKIPPNTTLQFDIEVVSWKGSDMTKDGQVTKIVLKKGDGHDRPNTGALLEAHITGKYQDKVFEDRDISFSFGEGSEIGLLTGVEEAIGKMVVNETADVFIHTAKYGFGEEGNPELGIPPNAPLNYCIAIKKLEKFSEAWELSNEEKIATALRVKEKGTKFYKEGKHKIACRQYGIVVNILEGYFDEEELQQANPIKVAGHLNIAACHLKLGNNCKCIRSCEKALEIDQGNIKALFRRGKARLMLKDYDQSKEDFLNVIRLDPKNKEAREQLNVVIKKLKTQRQKDKKTFENMFERLAEKDNKNKEQDIASPDVFTDAVEQAATRIDLNEVDMEETPEQC